jgi:hypothetical protein
MGRQLNWCKDTDFGYDGRWLKCQIVDGKSAQKTSLLNTLPITKLILTDPFQLPAIHHRITKRTPGSTQLKYLIKQAHKKCCIGVIS